MDQAFREKVARKTEKKRRIIRVASGMEKADLVLKNAVYLNVFSNEFCHGDIAVAEGLIVGMGQYSGVQEIDVTGKVVCPGFIDAHIHLESAMVTPDAFARAVLPHGTTTVITDPHEIANVMGTDGIEYMLQATQGLPIDVHFMLPSCVPATPYDESGASLSYEEIDRFYDHPKVLGLAEMMDYVGITKGEPGPVSKIVSAQAHHKKIDGHAPGLSGNDLNAYIAAGVYSDHECDTLAGALEKLQKGQFIMIREGTAAHNLRALMPLLNQQYYARCMFATDDKHPNDLLERGHIDYIVKDAIGMGVDPVIAIKVASHHAARYFLLNNKGAIAPGYLADMVVLDDFRSFTIEKVFKKGRLVFADGQVMDFAPPPVEERLQKLARDTFHLQPVTAASFAASGPRGLIGLVKGQILSQNLGTAQGIDVSRDILKIVCVERHRDTGHIGVGYLKGYGLRRGAVAASVAHDAHNIVAAGCTDEDLAAAVNCVIANKGGLAVVDGGKVIAELPLPIAGILSDAPLEEVNRALEYAKEQAVTLGAAQGIDPFMTLSFMSLPVIPSLRIMTQGVFDVEQQKYV